VAVASVKAYLAAGAVAGLLAGVLLAAAVVVTATPEATAVPEIAREVGVSVEEARVLYSALLFGVAVGVGFAMFIAWLLAALAWRLLEPRIDLPRPLLLVTPGLLAATAFLALDLFQADLRDVALITAVALAGIPEAEGEVGGSALAHLRGGAWGDASANPGGIERKARRPRAMGLVEGSPLRRARRGHREAARGERPPIAAGRPGGGSL